MLMTRDACWTFQMRRREHGDLATRCLTAIAWRVGAPWDGDLLLFATLGTMQVAGASLLTYYIAMPKYRLEKSDEAHLVLLPVLDHHTQGLWLSGRF